MCTTSSLQDWDTCACLHPLSQVISYSSVSSSSSPPHTHHSPSSEGLAEAPGAEGAAIVCSIMPPPAPLSPAGPCAAATTLDSAAAGVIALSSPSGCLAKSLVTSLPSSDSTAAATAGVCVCVSGTVCVLRTRSARWCSLDSSLRVA